MITVRTFDIVILPLIVLFTLSCDSRSPVQTADKISTANSRVSECGGFESPEKRMVNDIPITRDISTYCDSENLQWLYDENTLTLSVLNSRVLLNCCGEHDITASYEKRAIMLSVVSRTAEQVFMPLTVGGGIREIEDIRELLSAGADKISLNTPAVNIPMLLTIPSWMAVAPSATV